MKKIPTFLYFLLAIGLIIFAGWLTKKYLIPNQQKKIVYLEQQIAFLKQEVTPIKFKITEKTKDSISFKIKFLDLDGNTINKKQLTLYGNVVSFDFVVVKISDRYIAFPDKIFTNKIKPDDAIIIFDWYEKDGYPMIYYSKNLDKKFKEGVLAVYEKIKNKDYEGFDYISGNMVQNVAKAPTFKAGSTYKIIIHTKGGIEIVEE